MSTVDWPGIAVCTVFFRGCPVRCAYCHNRDLQEGEDWRDVEEVRELIRSSRMLVSGVVFSGGEPTLQKEPLIHLAGEARALGLRTGVQTNGVFPETLEALLAADLLDRVALDLKARWERYDNLLRKKFSKKVRTSLDLCTRAHQEQRLREFEVVLTLFRGYEDEVQYIVRNLKGGDLVLQQGVDGKIPPLSAAELRAIADRLGMRAKIRTREEGETVHDGTRHRRDARER